MVIAAFGQALSDHMSRKRFWPSSPVLPSHCALCGCSDGLTPWSQHSSRVLFRREVLCRAPVFSRSLFTEGLPLGCAGGRDPHSPRLSRGQQVRWLLSDHCSSTTRKTLPSSCCSRAPTVVISWLHPEIVPTWLPPHLRLVLRELLLSFSPPTPMATT